MINEREKKDKELIKLSKRYNELYSLIKESAVFHEYKKPIRNGYYLYLELIPSNSSKENEGLDKLVKLTTDKFWVERKNDLNHNFKHIQCAYARHIFEKKNFNLNTYKLKFSDLYEQQYEELISKYPYLTKYINGPYEVNYFHSYKRNKYLVCIPETMIKRKLEKCYLYGHYEYDYNLISERDVLNQKLFVNIKNRSRLTKIQGWKNWKYSYERVEEKINFERAVKEYFEENIISNEDDVNI